MVARASDVGADGGAGYAQTGGAITATVLLAAIKSVAVIVRAPTAPRLHRRVVKGRRMVVVLAVDIVMGWLWSLFARLSGGAHM